MSAIYIDKSSQMVLFIQEAKGRPGRGRRATSRSVYPADPLALRGFCDGENSLLARNLDPLAIEGAPLGATLDAGVGWAAVRLLQWNAVWECHGIEGYTLCLLSMKNGCIQFSLNI